MKSSSESENRGFSNVPIEALKAACKSLELKHGTQENVAEIKEFIKRIENENRPVIGR